MTDEERAQALREAVLATCRVSREQAAEGDYEAAHRQEDSATKLFVIGMAQGLDMRPVAGELLAYLEDKSFPRWCG